MLMLNTSNICPCIFIGVQHTEMRAGGGSGGRCTQKSAGAGYASAKLEGIMVKFRPIAPKPAVFGSTENKLVFTKTRAKRRYVRLKSNTKKVASEEKSSESDPSSGDRDMVTLSLLPETPGSVKGAPSGPPIQEESSPHTAAVQLQRQMVSSVSVGSLVVVECVDRSASDDLGMMVDLEKDTCPGFISDGRNRVWWTNQAYKMMVGSEIVWVVMNDRFPLTVASAFVCRVRLQYTSRNERKTMIVPCDVWRIDGGGFAWRLDVQAALSLGR